MNSDTGMTLTLSAGSVEFWQDLHGEFPGDCLCGGAADSLYGIFGGSDGVGQSWKFLNSGRPFRDRIPGSVHGCLGRGECSTSLLPPGFSTRPVFFSPERSGERVTYRFEIPANTKASLILPGMEEREYGSGCYEVMI